MIEANHNKNTEIGLIKHWTKTKRRLADGNTTALEKKQAIYSQASIGRQLLKKHGGQVGGVVIEVDGPLVTPPLDVSYV